VSWSRTGLLLLALLVSPFSWAELRLQLDEAALSISERQASQLYRRAFNSNLIGL
jgi:hypothetical protein